MTTLDDVAAAYEGSRPCACVESALVFAARILPMPSDAYGRKEALYALAAALVMEREDRGSK